MWLGPSETSLMWVCFCGEELRRTVARTGRSSFRILCLGRFRFRRLKGWCARALRRRGKVVQQRTSPESPGLSSGMRVGCCLFLGLGREAVVSFGVREGSSGRWVWMCWQEGLCSLVLVPDVEGSRLDSVLARYRGFSGQRDMMLQPDHLEVRERWRRLPW